MYINNLNIIDEAEVQYYLQLMLKPMEWEDDEWDVIARHYDYPDECAEMYNLTFADGEDNMGTVGITGTILRHIRREKLRHMKLQNEFVTEMVEI